MTDNNGSKNHIPTLYLFFQIKNLHQNDEPLIESNVALSLPLVCRITNEDYDILMIRKTLSGYHKLLLQYFHRKHVDFPFRSASWIRTSKYFQAFPDNPRNNLLWLVKINAILKAEWSGKTEFISSLAHCNWIAIN